MHETQRLLEVAAAPTFERIQRDVRKAPPQIRPLLQYLERHLFDAGLDANHLKRACGVRDNTLPMSFHHALSLPPYGYIVDCRMEVACRLLTGTNLKVWQIAQLLGYSNLPVFSRAFDRWSGLRPSEFRRLQEESEEALQEQPAVPDRPALPRLETLLKALRGRLDQSEADELSHLLSKLYPKSFQRA